MSGFSEGIAFVSPVSQLDSREGMCVACLFVGLVGLFLSYSFLKFNGTPLFSVRVSPELVAKQGKLASAPWLTRTD